MRYKGLAEIADIRRKADAVAKSRGPTEIKEMKERDFVA